MNRRLPLAVLAVSLAATALAPLGARATSGYSAGAAAVVITPPLSTGPADRVGSDLCPMAVFNGPSIWRQDEPYIDQDAGGSYDVGEPYCDANHNGRYDGIWVVGQVDHHANRLNDDLYARTFVVSDGTNAVAVSSVDALGLFDTDVEPARALAKANHPGLVDLFVSANHNESAPDSLGLWGPTPAAVGDDADFSVTAGVNDYYMDFLAQQIAASVDQAMASMAPATLKVRETTAPSIVPTLNHWPTTNRKDDTSAVPDPHAAGRIDAWDPTVRILQAVNENNSQTIFTTVGYDAHVQNLGHSSNPFWSYAITADWPGFFWADVEAAQGGVAIYLQGANGSIETPQVPSRHNADEGTIERSADIGHELAAVVNAALPGATSLAYGPIAAARETFTVPLENQLFTAAFAAHLFPHKPLVVPPVPPKAHPYLETQVGVVKIGPLELIANPGEAFPSLTKGSHWGIDEGCSVRPNPPVPSWASSATYRWDVGLANDMIGYEQPAWGWDSDQTTYLDPADACSMGQASNGNHKHGLEDESTGPSGGNIVAEHLASLIASLDGANANDVVAGRYLFADGTLSRRPYTMAYAHDGVVPVGQHAVGMVYGTGASQHVVGPSAGAQYGAYTVDQVGTFIDFDGRAQSAADDTTRGMQIGARATFLDVYPAWP